LQSVHLEFGIEVVQNLLHSLLFKLLLPLSALILFENDASCKVSLSKKMVLPVSCALKLRFIILVILVSMLGLLAVNAGKRVHQSVG
jgi:hypothetical protein